MLLMQVFLSYSRDDAELAKRLASQLSDAGIDVFFDANELMPGDNWSKRLGEALEKSDLLVALVTAGTFSEQQTREVQFALTEGRYGGRVIPVFVGPPGTQTEKLPWILRKLKPVQVDDPAELSKVVDQVQAMTA